MVKYSSKKNIKFKKILKLYKDCGWSSYTRNPEKLKKGIQQSNYVVTAWNKSELIGLSRVISDNETIVYIQDLLVRKNFRFKGIGSNLLKKVLGPFENIRQKVLIADSGDGLKEFYKKCGFKSAKELNIKAF